MSRPTPRRPSRTSTPRPRTLAGRSPGAPGAGADRAEEPVDAPGPAEDGPGDDWAVTGPESGRRSMLDSPRVTRVLTVVIGVLVVVLALQSAWWLRHELRDDPEPAKAAEGTIVVPDGRPVVPNELAVQEGVDTAAKAATKMFARTYQDYDAEVDAATAMMTDRFAVEYRGTTDDIKREFVARRTSVEVRVVGQGVVRANTSELQVLLFLDQYVNRGRGADARTAYTPYRALLTMVHTDRGWFVDDLETK